MVDRASPVTDTNSICKRHTCRKTGTQSFRSNGENSGQRGCQSCGSLSQADFSGTTFEEDANFNSSKIMSGLRFEKSFFKSSLHIRYLNVNGEFDPTDMIVRGSISSRYAKINGRTLIEYIFDQNQTLGD